MNRYVCRCVGLATRPAIVAAVATTISTISSRQLATSVENDSLDDLLALQLNNGGAAFVSQQPTSTIANQITATDSTTSQLRTVAIRIRQLRGCLQQHAVPPDAKKIIASFAAPPPELSRILCEVAPNDGENNEVTSERGTVHRAFTTCFQLIAEGLATSEEAKKRAFVPEGAFDEYSCQARAARRPLCLLLYLILSQALQDRKSFSDSRIIAVVRVALATNSKNLRTEDVHLLLRLAQLVSPVSQPALHGVLSDLVRVASFTVPLTRSVDTLGAVALRFSDLQFSATIDGLQSNLFGSIQERICHLVARDAILQPSPSALGMMLRATALRKKAATRTNRADAANVVDAQWIEFLAQQFIALPLPSEERSLRLPQQPRCSLHVSQALQALYDFVIVGARNADCRARLLAAVRDGAVTKNAQGDEPFNRHSNYNSIFSSPSDARRLAEVFGVLLSSTPPATIQVDGTTSEDLCVPLIEPFTSYILQHQISPTKLIHAPSWKVLNEGISIAVACRVARSLAKNRPALPRSTTYVRTLLKMLCRAEKLTSSPPAETFSRDAACEVWCFRTMSLSVLRQLLYAASRCAVSNEEVITLATERFQALRKENPNPPEGSSLSIEFDAVARSLHLMKSGRAQRQQRPAVTGQSDASENSTASTTAAAVHHNFTEPFPVTIARNDPFESWGIDLALDSIITAVKEPSPAHRAGLYGGAKLKLVAVNGDPTPTSKEAKEALQGLTSAMLHVACRIAVV